MKFKNSTLVNNVKEKMAVGEVALSMTIKLTRTIEIAEIAKSAGFDSIYIDLEHNSFSLDTTGQICLACLSAGITPLVRVPRNTGDVIGRVLDGGALGVIAPHIESAKDAQEVVRAAKYPPLGERSFTGSLPHLRYQTIPTSEVFSVMNEATMVVAMIESAEALRVIDEIAAVSGVDMLLIGTNDLCASLGIPGQLDHELIQQAYAKAMRACRMNGKQLGIGGLAAQPKLIEQYIQLGARYVSTGTDLSFLLAQASNKARQIREVCPSLSPTNLKKEGSTMAKAYWINTYREISNEEALAEYGKLAGPAIQAGGGRFVARGMPNVVYEAGMKQRTILIEFDSLEQAIATHDGPAYQAALKALGNGAVRDIRIIEAA
jgi:2-keto-3-deoxy-L-rhamnonate aldolase RhmA/uncharacterized protein (DUF1330 family)